ncbi:hypothetical protein EQV77_03675 [Halobacillus fulvus]|nr:hypothetical protein EQV77_03675 [Halobacillus fulvus]
MRKTVAALFLLSILFLSGCSLLEGANNTLNYVNESMEYANEASRFADEVPQLAEQAVNNPQVLNDFKSRLLQMQEDIEEFNALDPPGIGENLHQQVVGYNEQALEGIQLYLDNIENGTLDPDLIENTEVFRTFAEIQSLLNQIEQLGN